MDLKLPPLGEGADSGNVVSILVKVGDAIAKGQGIIELETGKAVAPVPASAAGKVTKIIVAVGDKISVGQPILSLEAAATAPAATPAPAKSARPSRLPPDVAPPRRPAAAASRREPEPPTGEEEAPGGAEPAASPSIRRMARELGIDLRKIRGSEHGGRMVMADVRAYIERLQRLAAQPRAAAAGRARPTAARAALISPNGDPLPGVRSRRCARLLPRGWRKAGTPFRASPSSTKRTSPPSTSCGKNTPPLSSKRARA